MGKPRLTELLECIRDEYFERSQQALAAAMGMKPPQLSRVMNAQKPKLTTERIVNLLNFLDTHSPNHTVTFDWLMRQKPRVVYGAHQEQGFGHTAESAQVGEIQNAARVAAGALLDLARVSSDAPSRPKVAAAVADLDKVRPGKPTT